MIKRTCYIILLLILFCPFLSEGSYPIKLNKTLFNMIENAIKYTKEGFGEFCYHIEDNKLVLYIKDTEVCILPENYSTI